MFKMLKYICTYLMIYRYYSLKREKWRHSWINKNCDKSLLVYLSFWKKMIPNVFCFFFSFAFSFIFVSWRLITLQYCSGFCHTLTWISHGVTYIPHPDPPCHLPLSPIPLGLPSAPGLSTCLMHPTWAGDLFHPRYYTCFDAVLLKHPTLAFSHRVQKSVVYICVSFSVLHIGLSLPSF